MQVGFLGFLRAVNYKKIVIRPFGLLAGINRSQHMAGMLVVGQVLNTVGGVSRAHKVFPVRLFGTALVEIFRREGLLVAFPFADVVAEDYLIVIVGAVVVPIYSVCRI